MPLPFDLDRVRAAPGMFVARAGFDTLAAYVDGLNAATNDSLLLGFHEWLVPLVNGGNQYIWSHLVLHLAFPGVEDPRAQLGEQENQRKAIECLFSSLEGFWAERSRPITGLRSIYLRYQAWLDRQEWYTPGHPEYDEIAKLREQFSGPAS
jgi:hypothetical protein